MRQELLLVRIQLPDHQHCLVASRDEVVAVTGPLQRVNACPMPVEFTAGDVLIRVLFLLSNELEKNIFVVDNDSVL